MTTAATRILPVAAILAAGAVVAVWYAGEGSRTTPGPITVAPAPPPRAAPQATQTPPEAPRRAPEVAAPMRETAGPPGRDGTPEAARTEAPRPDTTRPDMTRSEAARPEMPRGSERTASAAREASPPRAAEAPRYESPRFDVVRVGARGNAVVAGRASPGAEVVLFDGPREIGRARADSRGEWVILPADPVGSGARELSLRARMPGGEEVAGADTVLVVGPAVVAEAPAPAVTPSQAPSQAPAHAASQATATGARPSGEAARAPVEPRVAADRPSGDAAPTVAATSEPAAGRPGTAPAPEMAAPAPQEIPATARATPPAAAIPRAAEAPTVLLLPPTAQGGARPLSPSAPASPSSAGPQVFALGLDVVDYDDSNTMRFAGSAAPGSQVRVYADDRHLGDAQADATGRWTLSPEPAPPVGRHTLRVDQLASAAPGSGTVGAGTAAPGVASRIEVPFQREALPASFVRDGRVVVQPGNNLWRIAREAYGRGTRYTVIYRANQSQIRNPSLIYPGQIFAVPAVAENAAR